MKVAMGPPPPQTPSSESSNTPTFKVPMGPPPPKSPPKPIQEEEKEPQTPVITQQEEAPPVQEPIPDSITKESPALTIPYTIPPWSEPPCHPFFLEVLKEGSIITQLNVSEKGAYMFGRVDLCDFVLDNPTVSRFHAVMQFKQSGEAYLYDLGSTHGTSVNKKQVKKMVYTELHVGDVIKFGQSSRLYVFQGPTDLMPPEGDLKKIRSIKIQEELQDREASLLRAKQEASVADGISWGMAEDAIEEAEEDAEEVTWQTYKGELTERQQKTRDKVIKRIEKIANMKKEIDAIRVKDIPQGGLTQGQQTQIARNEQRTAQILEELESLEETLNESIQESIGARSGKIRSKKKGAVVEDEDEAPSDDDDFYDRAKKPVIKKAGEQQSVETADSLLDKKDAIMKEMENKQSLINEKDRNIAAHEGTSDGSSLDANDDGDPLDAYMTDLSTQLVSDSTMQLQNELSSLQTELDRIQFLLKIADPFGEAAKKREMKVELPKPNEAESSTSGITEFPLEKKKKTGLAKPTDDSIHPETTSDSVKEPTKVPEVEKNVTDVSESKASKYTIVKPQWLGAVHDTEMKENKKQREDTSDVNDSDLFVDYKDRKEALVTAVPAEAEPGIEAAAPGLIIRKRKQVEKTKEAEDETSVSTSSSSDAEASVANAMALLLKHEKGLQALEEEENSGNLEVGSQDTKKGKTKSRRVLGPEKPEFLNSKPGYEGWVPPKGQSGDGRTSLNDRFGY